MCYNQKNLTTGATLMLKLFRFVICSVFAVLMPASAFSFDRYVEHGGPVKDFSLSPDGETLASASYDYSIVLWDSHTLVSKSRLIGHDAAVVSLDFSPDGRVLVSGGDDYKALVWDLATGQSARAETEPIAALEHEGKITDVTISPDGQFIATSSWDGGIYLWSAQTYERITKLTGHKGPVNAVQFSQSKTSLYSAGTDGEIKAWDLSRLSYESTLARNGWGINVFHVDEEQGFVAFGAANGKAVIRSLSNGETLYSLEESNAPFLALDYHASSQLLGFGNAKGRVLLIDTKTAETLVDVKAASGPVWALKLLPHSQSIVTGGLDDAITRFDLGDPPWNFTLTIEQPRRFAAKGREISNGEKQFLRKCSICHTLSADGKFRAGPSLYNVFGRRAGTLEGYPYSDALKESQVIWTEETISDLFSKGPHIVTPGSKMPLQKIINDTDRSDLITYLKEASALE